MSEKQQKIKKHSKKEFKQKSNQKKKDHVIDKICLIFEVKTKDWMGEKITEENPLTLHHINERENKKYNIKGAGDSVVSNGAPLTVQSHLLLNFFRDNIPQLYEEWQSLFKTINKRQKALDESLKEEIRRLRIKSHCIYEYLKRMMYYEKQKDPYEELYCYERKMRKKRTYPNR